MLGRVNEGILSVVDIKIQRYTGGIAQTNAYLIKDGDSSLLIDAPEGVSQWLERIGEKPTELLLTHQHYDHVQGAAELAAQGVPILAHSPHSRDLTLENRVQAAGFEIYVEPYEVTTVLEGKTECVVGGMRFEIRHVPGHSPDSIVFIIDGYAFVGDTVFAQSIGRSDLPGGDMNLLVTGIQEKILTLADDTKLLPGHGPGTTVALEKSSNPFL